jgi:hypothetical protein
LYFCIVNVGRELGSASRRADGDQPGSRASREEGISWPLRSPRSFFAQRFQLGDSLKIPWPARGSLDFDQPIEIETSVMSVKLSPRWIVSTSR